MQYKFQELIIFLFSIFAAYLALCKQSIVSDIENYTDRYYQIGKLLFKLYFQIILIYRSRQIVENFKNMVDLVQVVIQA